MKNKIFVVTSCAGLLLASAILPAFACGPVSTNTLNSLARQAVSADTNVAVHAIAALRTQGPAGLEALLAANPEMLELQKEENRGRPDWPQLVALMRFHTALDAVSSQRDCSASHLFWYTDFDQAKAAAKYSGKPILSLRLLGRLDEEYSCANSRFFRTTLYANSEISKYLREHFILHWKSVRPVPRITVDFGDGRKIERTVTGNSIHYILDADGNAIDALPGLYAPGEFLKQLKTAEQEAIRFASDQSADRYFHLRQYHGQCAANSQSAFMNDYTRVTAIPIAQPGGTTVSTNPALTGIMSDPQFRAAIKALELRDGIDLLTAPEVADTALVQPVNGGSVRPTALAAGAISGSKFAVERPLLKSFQEIDDATWKKIAQLHQPDAILDPAAIRLIQAKAPSARDAGRVAVSKGVAETPFIRTIQNLQRSIAEDTVRNEYVLHSTIHEWFANQTAPKNLDELNARVYAQLFLTPDSDPWLGLVPADTFTGLEANGLVLTAQQNTPTIKATK